MTMGQQEPVWSWIVSEHGISGLSGEFDNRYCPACGRTMIKSGMSSTCYKCPHCGDTVGSCG